MLNVLVTGGAGYIGSILCEHLLLAGYKVTILDNLSYNQRSLFHLCSNKRFEFVRGDARDKHLVKSIIKNMDVIIPLAAVVGAPACEQNPNTAYSLNFEAISMLNNIRSPQQLVIFPNTNSGYGTKSGDIYCDENTPLQPISLYAETKVNAEQELLGTANTISLRLATVFGMSNRMRTDLLVNNFVYEALFRGYLVIFEKESKRNFIHIRDVADCFIHAIENSKEMSGRPYNVGLDTANISKEGLALKIAEYLPSFYIHFAEIGRDPDRRNYIVSNERLRKVGFEARRTLDEGIIELIKGYSMMKKDASNDALSNN